MRPLRTETVERSIYGIIIYLALLLTLEGKVSSAVEAILILLGSLVIIALAESYAAVVSHKFDGKKPSRQLILAEVRSASFVLIGSEIPVVILIFAAFDIISLQLAIVYSVVIAIALLFLYSYLGSRRLGRARTKSAFIGLGSLSIALLLVAFKLVL